MTEQVPSKPADHAGVWVPPPLLYGAVFGCGVLLHRLAPLTWVPRQPARAAAVLLLGAYVVLFAWGLLLFRRAGTSLVPVKPSLALVEHGPYRFTRNPMYLSLLCLYVAAALWFGVVWALILAPLLVLVVQRVVIAPEERYLERTFGDAYRQYRARVRRWV